MLFSLIVPEMFLRVQFGRIRGQKQKTQRVGQPGGIALVSDGAIEHHDDHVVVRIAAGNLVGEDLHAIEIDMRQHQTVEAAILRTHRAIGVGVLLRPASAWPAIACQYPIDGR